MAVRYSTDNYKLIDVLSAKYRTVNNFRPDYILSQKKITILASRGTLDMSYPPLILAATVIFLGFDVKI